MNMSNFVRLNYLNTNNHKLLPDLLVDDFELLSIDMNERRNEKKSFKYHSVHPPTKSPKESPTKSQKKLFKESKKPNVAKSYVSENGTLEMSDNKRFLRLGKISLYNGVDERYFSDKEYMGILDTLNGRVVCVDLDTIYTECVQKNNNTLSIGNMLFNITPETKKVVCDYIFNK